MAFPLTDPMAMSSRSPAAVVGEGNAKMAARKWAGWEEEIVWEEEDGKELRKVCYYYLCCAQPQGGGESERDLAVVGKDLGIGIITYTAHPKFLLSLEEAMKTAPQSSRVAAVGAEVTQLRWESRKEVMDWLTSLISDPPYGAFGLASPGDYDGPASKDTPSTLAVAAAGENKHGFTWLEEQRHLDRRRTHYRSFIREGMRISVHNFVHIGSEGREGHVAYVEDMYEDGSARKMVLARWFDKVDDDHGAMLPADVHNREVFFSYVLQDLRVESVVGLAAVLNSQHFEMFQRSEEGSNWQPYLCHRQIDDNTVQPFDMTQLQGYANQEIVRAIVKASSSRTVQATVHAKPPNIGKTAITANASPKLKKYCRAMRKRSSVEVGSSSIGSIDSTKEDHPLSSTDNEVESCRKIDDQDEFTIEEEDVELDGEEEDTRSFSRTTTRRKRSGRGPSKPPENPTPANGRPIIEPDENSHWKLIQPGTHRRHPNYLIGTLVKHHFPGMVKLSEDKPSSPGFTWEHYKAAIEDVGDRKITKADKIMLDLWNHFTCVEGKEDAATKVVVKVARARLADLKHMTRYRAVMRARPLDDKRKPMTKPVACATYDLDPNEYLSVKEPWIPSDCWEAMVDEWCSPKWKKKHVMKRDRRMKMKGQYRKKRKAYGGGGPSPSA